MEKVDYLMLSQQYANFLVAVGGVSITALTLVLSLSGKSKKKKAKMRPARKASRAFLVAALSVATVCCFIGAQMMAETAAFISHIQGKLPLLSGERPFLLASTNIFLAAVLVLFALMLLPTVSGEKQAASLATISASVFVLIVFGAICWMFRAGTSRMQAPSGWPIIAGAVIVSILWGALLYYFIKSKKSTKYLLTATFIPILFFTVASLLIFAWTFGAGDKSHDSDIFFFALAVTFSYTSLILISFKIMIDNTKSDVPGNPEHEQKESSEQGVAPKSRRSYFVPLLFASIFIASTTILLIAYKGRTTGEVNRPLSSDITIWVTVFTAIVSAIGTFSTIIFARRNDKREAREKELKIAQLERELTAPTEKPTLPIPEEDSK